ncbi:G-type lectin S-receptor-like serine/threonine-protein kinase SD2-5 [Chenopodium quinoa]|uniref:G-type lectin S-receptor-like serine/threonine-protein kinase SD2-5 n=1 Tax=Chenopodium quinoa TaxID=63459 RepID=UPI000B76FA03|nr:G-type lectin S-receptor-like serine/threonine-protein kinase SD2-5 [Chenopodium quinoa]
MGNLGFILLKCSVCILVFLAFSQPCIASVQQIGTITPGYQASQMSHIDHNGLFLLSNDSTFAFGFKPTNDATLFLLVIIHRDSSTIVWTTNTASPVANSDKFVFRTNSSVSLHSKGKAVWEPDTGGKLVSVIELQNSGNLVLFGSDNSTIVWESFRYPTNTLLSNQNFVQGMQLSSIPDPTKSNLTYALEIKFGDMILSTRHKTPQTYWSMRKDTRKIIDKDGGVISSARIESNSWKFFDKNKALLWQFVLSSNPTAMNSTWVAVLRSDGILALYTLGNGPLKVNSAVKIPNDPCGTPEPCDVYLACSSSRCRCPSGLVSRSCNAGISAPCGNPDERYDLVNAGDDLSYFALWFTEPSMKTNFDGCQASCASNCSCLGLIFDKTSHNCFLFDWIGSFVSDPSSKYSVYVKVSKNGVVGEVDDRSKSKHLAIVVSIVVFTVFIVAMVCGGYWYYMKKKEALKSFLVTSEDESFFESFSGMPVRYSYRFLQEATNNFSLKLGQGGFGSVYRGKLPDGTLLAVKKLEGMGQGVKEFRAEVSIIGSIHHIHLVKIKGFCTEGNHWLLVYEFMENGSLDKWIFKRNIDNDCVLDWPTRFNIAVSTAKGLAYLHEDCEVKIVHCDIKPENVLLDAHFVAKVSDFGLAKLMTREQSHVFTTLRGTRGYLAPEWITNYAISEKSDVYSYGMVLLEIIGGRKNYDPSLPSEKSHFASYVFKMMEEGKLREILDSSLEYDPNEESVRIAIKVALWCIQEDMSMRPPMTTVVQMLEGVCPVPHPPTSSLTSVGFSPKLYKWTGNGTRRSSVLSAVQLSGPR